MTVVTTPAVVRNLTVTNNFKTALIPSAGTCNRLWDWPKGSKVITTGDKKMFYSMAQRDVLKLRRALLNSKYMGQNLFCFVAIIGPALTFIYF